MSRGAVNIRDLPPAARARVEAQAAAQGSTPPRAPDGRQTAAPRGGRAVSPGWAAAGAWAIARRHGALGALAAYFAAGGRAPRLGRVARFLVKLLALVLVLVIAGALIGSTALALVLAADAVAILARALVRTRRPPAPPA